MIDLCAGAGGKTLALAAMMENHGQLYATDTDKRRLAPIHDRLERAGAHNVQVHTPRGEKDALADLEGRADLVLIDAPCTGTGAWRRNPDAKWRVRPGALAERLKDQAEALDRAAPLVKPGGRIAYVTCSVLDDENGAQVRGFLARHAGFAIVPPADVTAALGERAFLFRRAVLLSDEGLLMTPRRTGTDGFFVSILRRARLAVIPGERSETRDPSGTSAQEKWVPDRRCRGFRDDSCEWSPPAIAAQPDPLPARNDARQDSHRRFRLAGHPAHRPARARGGGLLRDRAVPEGRRSLRRDEAARRDPLGRTRHRCTEAGSPARAAGDLRCRRAGARHLLRPA